MISEERLEEIEERAKAATPGPWRDRALLDGTFLVYGAAPVGEAQGFLCATASPPAQADPRSDFDFMAAAREDVPALVAEVRRQRRRCEDMEEEVRALEERLIALRGDERRRG